MGILNGAAKQRSGVHISEFKVKPLNVRTTSSPTKPSDDIELLCIKYDLLSNQLIAIVRSGCTADLPTTGHPFASTNLKATEQSR